MINFNNLGLKLIEPEHYYKDEKKKRYTSVTTFLKQFEPPFDVDNSKAEKKAKEINRSVEDVKTLWRASGIEAGIFGSEIHKKIEDFINSRGTVNEHDFVIRRVLNLFLNLFTEEAFKERDYKTEQIIGDDVLGIAGTIDLITEFGGKYYIIDWKTNKKITTTPYIEDEMLYEPFDFLMNTHHDKYLLQIYTYMSILSLNFDIEFGGAFLGHIPSIDPTGSSDSTYTLYDPDKSKGLFDRIYKIFEGFKRDGKLPELERDSIAEIDSKAEFALEVFKHDFTKNSVEELANKIANPVLDGHNSSLSTHVNLKFFIAVCEAAIKKIKNQTVEEIEKHPENDRNYRGATFSTMQTPSFEFNDPKLKELEDELKAYKDTLKSLEDPIYDEDEKRWLTPPTVTYSESPRITFPKEKIKKK